MKHLWDYFHADLNKINVNNSEDPDLCPNKREFRWRGFNLSFFFFVKKYLEYTKCGKQPAVSSCVT
jgi:hypothetical protein